MTTPSANAPTRAAQIQRVLIGLLAANLAVVGAKFVVGVGVGSLAVLSDAVHASVDAMNNVLALVVMFIASRGPDEDHPYGHQKFETLGALAIVGFLSISGFELVKGAVTRLIRGSERLEIGSLQLGLLLATLVVNVLVATYESRRGRELDSDILLADAAHTKADVLITLSVLVSVLLARQGLTWADPVVALLVAVVIVVLASKIVLRSVPVLVDQHVVRSDVIQSTAELVEGVVSAYDIRSRGSGNRTFAELTIAVERTASVEAAHQIADRVEDNLRAELQFSEIVVHVEPC